MPPTLEQLQERYGERYRWLVLLTVLVGTMASILSSTIVNVAVPELSQHFQIGQESAQWVSTSFMLAMTLAMLTTPWMLLRFGLRRLYTGAILLLLFGGVVGGFSVNYSMLISMRILEGIASGIIQPIPAIIILRVFSQHEQGKAMGIFGFGVVFAPALGPSVGGFLVEMFGWRSIFFVVVPFCVGVLFLIRRFLAVNSIFSGDAQSLDWKGLLLAGISTISFLNGLVELHENRMLALALLATGVITLVIFVLYQLRATNPLLQMRLFSHRQFTAGALVAFIYGMGLFGSTYLFPVYMQIAMEYSPSDAGLVLLPAGIVLALVIPIAGRLADRYPPNILVAIGLALLGVSFALMATGNVATSYVTLMGWAIIGRVGLGFVLPALNLGAMRGMPPPLITQGASAINFFRQLGGAIGISVIGVVLEWRLDVHHAALDGTGASNQAARVAAFDETFLLTAVLCGLAVIAAWNMRQKNPPIDHTQG